MSELLFGSKPFLFKRQAFALLFVFFLMGCENQFIESLDISEKSIALTFDDGPDPVYTSEILDVLKEKDVKATFFLLGNKMKQNPGLTERIFEEGHCLANHTYSHIDLKEKSLKEIFSEIQQTEQILVGACGESNKLFRPPWGHITSSEKAALIKNGYKVVLWDVNSRDYKPGISVNEIVDNIMNNLGDNRIILFHDSDYQGKASRKNTARALPIIIDFLKVLGYKFVTVDKIKVHNK